MSPFSSSTPPHDGPQLAILYEHPDWFGPLFRALDARGVAYRALPASRHHFDPGQREVPGHVVLNRMSPSAHLRGGARQIHYTTQYLEHLERRGARVINGVDAWRVEISKAAQLLLLEQLGLPFPATRVFHDPAAAPEAARGLRFPIVVKPNVGGSGAGVVRFDTPGSLARGAAEGALDMGVDGTALVQEFVPARDGRIVRVEVLDGTFLYAIRIYTPGDQFNLCPADVCRGVDGAVLERTACPADAPTNDLRVEGYDPPREIVRQVEAITRSAGMEIGGVEYLVDDRDGRLLFYDVNALSNFVADAPRVVGFDPFQRLAAWLEREVASAAGRPAEGIPPAPATATPAPVGLRSGEAP
jgi:hypothetical protein